MANITWKTMTARYASKCKRCGGNIAIGSEFRYGRAQGWTKGIGYHLVKDCPGAPAAVPVVTPSALESSADAAAEWAIDAAMSEAATK